MLEHEKKTWSLIHETLKYIDGSLPRWRRRDFQLTDPYDSSYLVLGTNEMVAHGNFCPATRELLYTQRRGGFLCLHLSS